MVVNPNVATDLKDTQSKTWQKTLMVSVILFMVVFVVYFLSPVIQSSDSRLSIYVSMSIIRQGNIDLDEYNDWIEGYYALQPLNGHIYNKYPIGPSLIALPFAWIADTVSGGTFNDSLLTSWPVLLEIIIACFVVALAAVFVFLTAHLYLPLLPSLFIAAIFAFCTSAWGIASRALWQHGPSMLVLELVLYLLARQQKSLLSVVGFVAGFSYLIRPSNAITIVIVALYVAVVYRRYFVYYLLGLALCLVPFILHSLSVYQTLVPTYYLQQGVSFQRFFEALAGHFISPARGLLVFSPILLLSFVGIGIKLRERTFNRLDLAMSAILFLHWIAISLFLDWVGGLSYGSRYFSDVVPYFVYFTIPAVAWLIKRRSIAWGAVAVLFVVSFYIQYYGATHQETTYTWYDPYIMSPSPIWDWGHLEFIDSPRDEAIYIDSVR
jgi:hypothetical protein